MSFNQVTLVGNLTRDPESRFTPKGTPVAKFSLGVNRRWKDEAGNEKEEATFVDCAAFGKTADLINQYFKKGRELMLTGRLRQETWMDKTTNEKRSKLGVIVEEIVFLQRNDAKPSEPPPAGDKTPLPPPSRQPAPKSPTPKTAKADGDEDVPF